MFDPFSALAIIGFATGTISFLAATLSAVDEKVERIKECKDRLRSYSWQLQDGHLQLTSWRWIWLGKQPFSDETYIHFWGDEGFRNIQSRFQDILSLSKQIESLLMTVTVKDIRLSREQCAWLQLQDHSSLDSSLDSEKIGMVQRVCFSLFNNASLAEKVSRFRSQIQGLEDCSRIYFRQQQGQDPGEKITNSELQDFRNLTNSLDSVSTFARYLHESNLPCLNWAIELSPPETTQTFQDWQPFEDFDVDFIIRYRNPDSPYTAKRIRIHQSSNNVETKENSELIVQRIEALFTGNSCHQPSTPGHSFTVLAEPMKRSRPLRKMLNGGIVAENRLKSFDVERVNLAYGLAHWIIVLWNTPWSSSLCSCGIRFIQLYDHDTRHSFRKLEHAHWPPDCHDSELDDKKLLLLGVILAELTLLSPISVRLEGDGVKFCVEGAWISRIQLLNRLRGEAGRSTITKAVKYCLNPDSVVYNDLIAPNDIKDYFENILLPIEKYRQIILRHASGKQERRLRDRNHDQFLEYYNSDQEYE